MDRFVRVDKKREEVPIEENEVRVTAVGKLHNYINYAASLILVRKRKNSSLVKR